MATLLLVLIASLILWLRIQAWVSRELDAHVRALESKIDALDRQINALQARLAKYEEKPPEHLPTGALAPAATTSAVPAAGPASMSAMATAPPAASLPSVVQADSAATPGTPDIPEAAPTAAVPSARDEDSARRVPALSPVGRKGGLLDSSERAAAMAAVTEALDEARGLSDIHSATDEPTDAAMDSSAADTSRRRSAEEWEVLVGGNWLNKLGVLILVVGLSLFLGYSLRELGPAGRVALGYVASLALLGTGVVLERRDAYRRFARGLVGGGWAAIYFTTFAVHGLEASRVVTSPWLASVLLTVVAAGMVAHSLSYRSQTVTGLAYFIAFFTLAISPASLFGLTATVPLAASLLIVASRFEWPVMAVSGLAFTYGAYLFTSAGAVEPSVGSLMLGQAILGSYWVMFELMDIIGLRRAASAGRIGTALMSLNSAAFLGVSMLQWMAVSPETVDRLLLIAAAAHAGSARLRAWLLPDVQAGEGTAEFETRVPRGFRTSTAIATALLTVAVLLRFDGLWADNVLLLEGQLLLLAGLALRQSWFRTLASVVLLLAVARLLGVDFPDWPALVAGGPAPELLSPWPLSAVGASAMLYLSRALVHRRSRVGLEHLYTWAGTVLMVVLLARQAPFHHVPGAWLILAFALVEMGRVGRLIELRWQAAIVGALGFAGALALPSANGLTLSAVVVLAAAIRSYVFPPPNLEDTGRLLPRVAVSWAAVVLATKWLGMTMPAAHLGTACVALALALALLAARSGHRELEWQALLPFGLGYLFLLFEMLLQRTAHPWLQLLPSIAMLWTASAGYPWRLSEPLRAGAFTSATLLAALLIFDVFPPPWLAPAWAGLALGLAVLGRVRNEDLVVWHAHAVGLAAFFAAFSVLDRAFQGGVRIAGPSMAALVSVIVLFYAVAAVCARASRAAAATWTSAAAVLAVALTVNVALPPYAGLALSVLMLGLMLAANGLRWRPLAYQACAVGTFAALTQAVFVAGPAAGVRAGIGAAVVLAFLIMMLLLPRAGQTARWSEEADDGLLRNVFALLTTGLLTLLVFREVPSRLLTPALGIEGIALLAAGLIWSERTLRLSGLALFGLAVVKAFAIDLRQLAPPAQIASFVGLGLALILASWAYTRFREQVRRML